MVELCDVCRKGEIRNSDEVSFAFYRCHMGDGKFFPVVTRKVKACSVECFELWYQKFKKQYEKNKNLYASWRK